MKIRIDIESDNIFENVHKIRICSHGRTMKSDFTEGKRPEMFEAIKAGLWELNNSFIHESVEYWEQRVANSGVDPLQDKLEKEDSEEK